MRDAQCKMDCINHSGFQCKTAEARAVQFTALNIAGRVCDTGAPCRMAVSGCRGVGLIRCRQLLANDRNPRPESLLTARRERFTSSIFERCTWIYTPRQNWGFRIFECCVWRQVEIDFWNCFVSALAISCFQRQSVE